MNFWLRDILVYVIVTVSMPAVACACTD